MTKIKQVRRLIHHFWSFDWVPICCCVEPKYTSLNTERKGMKDFDSVSKP